MAELPDIDTSNVSFLAYWNVLSQGGISDFDPSDVTSDSSIESYTLYDNGLEGDYTLDNGRTGARFRVKSDGWFVTWVDRSETLDRGTEVPRENMHGPFDAVNWTDTTPVTASPNSLSNAINSLRSNLSNAGSTTFSASDVGLYNYAHTDATTLTILCEEKNDGGSQTASFQFTSSTTIDYLRLPCICFVENDFTSGEDGHVDFEGLRIAAYPSVDGRKAYGYGVMDPQAEGVLNGAGVDNSFSMYNLYGNSVTDLATVMAVFH